MKKTEYNIGRWSNQEQQIFLKAIRCLGKNWKIISKLVGTRTPNQVRSHAQKLQNRLGLRNIEKIKIITRKESATQYGEGIIFFSLDS